MKKYKKPVFSLLIICGLAFFAFGLSFNLAKCQAADNITTKMIGSITNITLPSAGTSQADINNKTHHIVGKAINAFISFLGIIFLPDLLLWRMGRLLLVRYLTREGDRWVV